MKKNRYLHRLNKVQQETKEKAKEAYQKGYKEGYDKAVMAFCKLFDVQLCQQGIDYSDAGLDVNVKKEIEYKYSELLKILRKEI